MGLLNGSFEYDVRKIKVFSRWVIGLGDKNIRKIKLFFRVLRN